MTFQKKGNVKRHFRTVHKNYDTEFPPKSKQRRRKVKELKSQLSGQQSSFTQQTSKARASVIRDNIVVDCTANQGMINMYKHDLMTN